MTIIAHQFNKVEISQLSEDTVIGGKLIPKGYVNATAMCKANGKRWAKYLEFSKTQPFLQALSVITESPSKGLSYYTVDSGSAEFIGTWASLPVAMNLAQWISPEFAAWASIVLAAVASGDYLALTEEATIAEAKLKERWDKIRAAGKETRRTFTDCLTDYIATCDRSDGYKNNLYTNVSDILNRAIFGKSAKQLCEERRCDRDHLRDTHEEKDLRLIDRVEAHAMKLIDKRGIEPMGAIREALDFYL